MLLPRVASGLALCASVLAGHDQRSTQPGGGCVKPGQCTPPPSKFSRVLPVTPRQQWNSAGGFCGSMSIQTGALAHGAWISQDLVRKANTFGAGHCDGGTPGHPGKEKLGCEVGALNIGQTAANLKLVYDEWDYNSTKPQSPRYKKWMKSHLAKGHAIVWLVMCKGDNPCPYPNACPNGGAFGHVEPVWGIFSNHSLDDPEIYPDDWIVHSSDQDLNPYYRPFHTLEDSTKMDGNCATAQAGYGRNEMYPCINDQTDYGIAIMGIEGGGLPVALAVDSQDEPSTRSGQLPSMMSATVTVSNLTLGAQYVLYRYRGVHSLPVDGGSPSGYETKTAFTATGHTFVLKDPRKILSDTAVYYRALPA